LLNLGSNSLDCCNVFQLKQWCISIDKGNLPTECVSYVGQIKQKLFGDEPSNSAATEPPSAAPQNSAETAVLAAAMPTMTSFPTMAVVPTMSSIPSEVVVPTVFSTNPLPKNFGDFSVNDSVFDLLEQCSSSFNVGDS
jgi:hypothetical protein